MNLAALKYKPEYRVELGDNEISDAMRRAITDVRFSSGLEAADRVELTLHDPQFRWIEDPMFALGGRLILSLGYAPDPLERMFVGKICTLSSDFPSTGAVTLNVAAQDARFAMTRSKKTRWFAIAGGSGQACPMPDMMVSSLVSAGHLLLPMFDPVAAGISVLLGAVDMAVAVGDNEAVQALIRHQAGQSDYDFLSTIAKENGWEVVVEHSDPVGGHKLRFFAPAGYVEPTATYEYGRSLLSFTPRLTEVGQVAKVSTKFWVPEIKTGFTAAVGYDWDRNELTLQLTPTWPGACDNIGEDDGPTFELGIVAANQYNAARLLVGKLVATLNRHLTASASVLGNPALRAGEVVDIKGVGPYSSLYRIVDAEHSIGTGGYTTELTLRKEIWFDTPAIEAPGASLSF